MTMNRFFVLLIAALFLLTSCNQLEPIVEEENDCLISFNLLGEITSSDTPITKSSSEDLFFVQIYRGSNPFAFGLFDDLSKIKFNLKTGTPMYRIIVCMVKNGKANPSFRYSADNNSLVPDFHDTFYYGYSYSYYYPINRIYYNSIGKLYYFSGPSTNTLYSKSATSLFLERIIIAQTNMGGIDGYPQCDDWLYGEINEYSPVGEYETLNMTLKRVGFKLKYELSGVTDGEVRVRVYNSDKTFIDNTTNNATYSSEPFFYAFHETRNAWLYSDDYMENFTLAVSWLRGIGITEDYGTKTIQLKRNCLNNIKINLGSNDQNAGMNLTVEAESTIGADNVTIPVE